MNRNDVMIIADEQLNEINVIVNNINVLKITNITKFSAHVLPDVSRHSHGRFDTLTDVPL